MAQRDKLDYRGAIILTVQVPPNASGLQLISIVSCDSGIQPTYGNIRPQCIALEQSSTIADLRKAIEKATGLPTSAYEISSHHSARHDDASPVFGDKIDTATFHPPEFTVIYSPYRGGKQPKGPMRIHITPEGYTKSVTILCQPNYTFDELGTRIEQEISNFPRLSQRLYVGRRFLDDATCRRYTLSSLNLVDVSYLPLIPFVAGERA